MFDPNFALLYVSSPEASAKFYSELLGRAPIEASPTFAMFKLESGVMLGLWARHTVEPAATSVGGSELAFAVADNTTVDSIYDKWSTRGLAIEQTPCKLDFGYTFVAQDPDGHRLRVFAPA
ncbi:VOC family protein [Undibacterium pigrum]|uniref:Catechol 2,3-dioxygenase-like lactoylglutathione lyase family enzyme n=1 Tax=Undibacterium pigrum TaxID=401470 RepID=A0A318IWV2_9BURK|nr:VOC family protein [Undibacterium pigrum]PXX39949.1 catechol 2,3-dioxygenase-like lactoylglutathione lyase family enzyme [Undibacterium pigrum]